MVGDADPSSSLPTRTSAFSSRERQELAGNTAPSFIEACEDGLVADGDGALSVEL